MFQENLNLNKEWRNFGLSVKNAAQSFGFFPTRQVPFIQKVVQTIKYVLLVKSKAKTVLMYEYIISIKNQFDLYFDILKFFFYFCIGALLLFLLKKIFKFFQFLTYKFNKDFFFEKLQLSLNIFLFVIISILLGWLVVYLLTSDMFLK